jgi:DMSO/TMAO reductase YedYZ molybdopterin-dependent catalytic subunit
VATLTRGFAGRGGPADERRLPPGQHEVEIWPVLSAEPTPRPDLSAWTFTVEGQVRNPTTWTWDAIHALPASSYDGDIHCVTTWSKFGIRFTGVSLDTLLAEAGPLPTATHLVAYSHTGYTTNLPLGDATGGQAWVAWEVDGHPLQSEHGGPARFLVPYLYFWKSAKWVAGVRLLDHDEPGFWETRGYHNHGDPWREQRYDGD